jgi:glycerophosphoryl diester phosphodiesterase
MTRRDPFLCIGHRGARGHAPENTLLAMDTGIRLGAQMVELDVQRHPSGELLVIHDLRLERTTNGKGRLVDRSFDYIRSLDAGGGQQVPTLPEVLDLVDQRVAVNVELKTAGGTAEAVAAVLRRYVDEGWSPEQFLVSSFHLPELELFRQAAPEFPIGVLLCGVPLEWAAEAAELSAQALNLSEEFADERLIGDAKARGLKVYVYTVNERDEIERLRQIGVDGVFTDYPERALF